jgi:hypothetical protein
MSVLDQKRTRAALAPFALDQKRHLRCKNHVRFAPKADICSAIVRVRFGPKADSCSAAKRIAIRSLRRPLSAAFAAHIRP